MEKKKLFNNLMESGKKAGESLAKSGKAALDKAGEVAVAAKEKAGDFADWADDTKDKATIVLGTVEEAAGKMVDQVKASKEEMDRKLLRPFFKESIYKEDFLMPQLLNVCEVDEKRMSNPVCVGSIGYESNEKELEVLNIYEDNVNVFDITFFPSLSCTSYLKNPINPKEYIRADKYFTHIMEEQVMELVDIANSLGAKRCKVDTYVSKIEKGSSDLKGGLKILKAKVEVSTSDAHKQKESVGISADELWSGHDDPVKPVLTYFKNEKHIQKLIDMRLDNKNNLRTQKYKIDCSTSASISHKEAIKIESALKSLKVSGSETFASSAENASESYFEYIIDFE